MKPHPIIHAPFPDSRMVSSLCNRIITDLASLYLPPQIPGLQRAILVDYYMPRFLAVGS